MKYFLGKPFRHCSINKSCGKLADRPVLGFAVCCIVTKVMAYNAFISYAHTADVTVAAALQSALHSFAKPWYKLRALRIFR